MTERRPPPPLREATPADLSFMLASRLRHEYNSGNSIHHNWPPSSVKAWLHQLYPDFEGTSIENLKKRALAGDAKAQLLMGDVVFCGFGVSLSGDHYVNVQHVDHDCNESCWVCYNAAVDWYNMASENNNMEARVQMAIILKMRFMQTLQGSDVGPFRAALMPLPAHHDGGNMVNFLEQAAKAGYISIFTILTAMQIQKKGKRKVPPHMLKALQQYTQELQQQQQQKLSLSLDQVSIKKCGNRSCQQVLSHQIYKCRQCRSKIYCSAICQIEHWDSQHRLVCDRQYANAKLPPTLQNDENNNKSLAIVLPGGKTLIVPRGPALSAISSAASAEQNVIEEAAQESTTTAKGECCEKKLPLHEKENNGGMELKMSLKDDAGVREKATILHGASTVMDTCNGETNALDDTVGANLQANGYSTGRSIMDACYGETTGAIPNIIALMNAMGIKEDEPLVRKETVLDVYMQQVCKVNNKSHSKAAALIATAFLGTIDENFQRDVEIESLYGQTEQLAFDIKTMRDDLMTCSCREKEKELEVMYTKKSELEQKLQHLVCYQKEAFEKILLQGKAEKEKDQSKASAGCNGTEAAKLTKKDRDSLLQRSNHLSLEIQFLQDHLEKGEEAIRETADESLKEIQKKTKLAMEKALEKKQSEQKQVLDKLLSDATEEENDQSKLPSSHCNNAVLDVSQLTDKSRELVLNRYKSVASVALNSVLFHEGTTIDQLLKIFETLMLSRNYTDALECLSFAAKKLLVEHNSQSGDPVKLRKLVAKILGDRVSLLIQVARVSPSEYVCNRILEDCVVLLQLGVVDPQEDFSNEDYTRLVGIEEETKKIKHELLHGSNDEGAEDASLIRAASSSSSSSSFTARSGRRKRKSGKGKHGKRKSATSANKTCKPVIQAKLVHLSAYLFISNVATNAKSPDDCCPICHVQWRHMDMDDACFAIVFRRCQHAVCAKCLSVLHKSCQETFEHETAEEEQQVKFVCTLCRERLPRNLPTDAAKELVSRNLVDSFPQFVEFFPAQFDTKSILVSLLLEHDFQLSKVENAMFATMQLLGNDHGPATPADSSLQQDIIYEQARFPVEPLYGKVREAERKLDNLWNTASREYQEALIELNRARKDLKKAKINAMKDVYERMNHGSHAAAAQPSHNNANGDLVCVDLHGLHPYEAPRILAEFVLPALPVLNSLVLITGRGNHCESGESTLKQKVKDYLSSKTCVVQSVQEVENNPGRLLVIAATA